MFLQRGKGAHVWDVDGNKYIDYPMALGAILLGHAHPKVVDAVTKQMQDGTLFTLMHPKEVELAEQLIDMIPCADQVRFGKNGADATAAAIRCARALTGRDDVAYCGYHGYQDWYAAIHPRNKGVPAVMRSLMHEFTYNQIESLERIFAANPGKVAAVIMEQPPTEPTDHFLQKCIDLAHKHGALFILDEIVTGFRYAKGGAQERYGIKPDLACFGKAMGNGMPIGAVVGQIHIMAEFDNIFFSTTFGGETASLAACLAVTDIVKNEGVVDHIWSLGDYWIKSFNEVKQAIGGVDVRLIGNAARSILEFRDAAGNISVDIRSLFLQETVKRGILFGVPIFMTLSHTKTEIDQTVDACATALKICKKAIEDNNIDSLMEGEKIGLLFRPQPKIGKS